MKIKCQNCGENIKVTFNKNRWTESFRGECWECGWKFMLKDTEFDFIQPDSPFFEMIYKHRPEKDTEKNEKIAEWEEKQRRAGLEEKYYHRYRSKSSRGSFRKPWERRAIEKEVLD